MTTKNTPTPEQKKRNTGCIALAVLAIFFFVAFKCACGDSPEELKAQKEANRALTAKVLARQFVEQRLVSPGTADFGYDAQVQKLNDSTYYIENYVDSQNGFGALLRSNYKCEVILRSDSTGVCSYLNIE